MQQAELLQRIEERLKALGISAAAASRAAGASDAIRNIRRAVRAGKETSVSVRTLQALAGVLQTSPGWLLSGEEPAPPAPSNVAIVDIARGGPPEGGVRVPILGVVAGASISSFHIVNQQIDSVARPPGLAHVADAYALWVINESMAPMYAPGDLCFIHPHKPAARNDAVVVRMKSGEAYLKLFERRDDRWLVCRQLKPAAEVKFAIAEVDSVHRVLTVAELFSA